MKEFILLNDNGDVQNVYLAEEALPNTNSIENEWQGFHIATGDNMHDKFAKFTRRNILNDCDWTDLPNAPLTDAEKAEWQTYRQALRDITDQSGYPTDINWPTQPE